MKARIPKEYSAGPSNMQGMLKQAQKMQEQMNQTQAELEAKEYEVKAGGGVVTIKMNGKKEIVSLDISPDPDDIETLADVITAGVNEAIKTVETDFNNEMGKITGGMGAMGGMGGLGGMMPGLF